jgi:hypothetical protein
VSEEVRGSIHVFDDRLVLWTSSGATTGRALTADPDSPPAEIGGLLRRSTQALDEHVFEASSELEATGAGSWRSLWDTSRDVWFSVRAGTLVLMPTERTRRHSWRQLEPEAWVSARLDASDDDLARAFQEALARSS